MGRLLMIRYKVEKISDNKYLYIVDYSWIWLIGWLSIFIAHVLFMNYLDDIFFILLTTPITLWIHISWSHWTGEKNSIWEVYTNGQKN